jgi:hypothetical protein
MKMKRPMTLACISFAVFLLLILDRFYFIASLVSLRL